MTFNQLTAGYVRISHKNDLGSFRVCGRDDRQEFHKAIFSAQHCRILPILRIHAMTVAIQEILLHGSEKGNAQEEVGPSPVSRADHVPQNFDFTVQIP